jgi:hypothetical protein
MHTTATEFRDGNSTSGRFAGFRPYGRYTDNGGNGAVDGAAKRPAKRLISEATS